MKNDEPERLSCEWHAEQADAEECIALGALDYANSKTVLSIMEEADAYRDRAAKLRELDQRRALMAGVEWLGSRRTHQWGQGTKCCLWCGGIYPQQFNPVGDHEHAAHVKGHTDDCPYVALTKETTDG